MDLYPKRGGGGKLDYPEKTLTSSPKIVITQLFKVKNLLPLLGVKPSPSNIGGKFAVRMNVALTS